MLLASLFLGCADPVELGETPPPEDPTGASTAGECDWKPGRSACGDKASIVQALVQVPPGSPTTGDLVVAMMHRRMGEPAVGGHPHWAWTFEDVDLTEPVPISVDMCDGNAIMWSEENCEFNLIVVLDGDGDNGLREPAFATPGPGEPSAMVTFDLSCRADGPLCLGTIELDCADGADCIADTDPGECACAAERCDSESAICEL